MLIPKINNNILKNFRFHENNKFILKKQKIEKIRKI